MGLLGALAGGAAAFNQVADHEIAMIDEKEMMAMKKQAEIAREKRITEAQRGNMAIENQYRIDAEKRGLENEKTRAQQNIDIATDPNNVGKITDAELYKKRSMDEYGDSRSDIEIAQAAKKAAAIDAATYHDNTDYVGRSLDHQFKQAQLDDIKSGKHFSDAEKMALSDLKEQRKELGKQYDDASAYVDKLESEGADGTLIIKARKRVQSIQSEMVDINRQAKAIWGKANGGSLTDEGGAEAKDPAAELIKRETLKTRIKQIDPQVQDKGPNGGAGGIDDLDSDQLETLLADLEKQKGQPKNKAVKTEESKADNSQSQGNGLLGKFFKTMSSEGSDKLLKQADYLLRKGATNTSTPDGQYIERIRANKNLSDEQKRDAIYSYLANNA